MKLLFTIYALAACTMAGNSYGQVAHSSGSAGAYQGAAADTRTPAANTSSNSNQGGYVATREPAAQPVAINTNMPDRNTYNRVPDAGASSAAYRSGNYSGNGGVNNGLVAEKQRAWTGTHIATQPVPVRYNYAARKPYPYCSTEITRRHSRAHTDRKACISYRGNVPWVAECDAFYNAYYFACCMEDGLLLSNRVLPANSALYNSYDGYLVYDGDTLSGIITMTDNSVYLEQIVDAKTEYGYNAGFTDSSLNEVVVFDGMREVHFARVSAKDKRLWRVLHTGKLNLYDNSYSFISANNIERAHLRVESGGKIADLDTRWQLINQVNLAYGTKFGGKEMKWAGLLDYIDGLDR